MELKNLIWRFMLVSVCLVSAQYTIAQTENTGEDPFEALHVTFPGELIYTTEPNNIWEPEAKLVKTEYRKALQTMVDSPRSITYFIYADGTQKCKRENGDFFYIKPASILNEFTGEQEPNLNYRLPSTNSEVTGYPSVYFPNKRGILARKTRNNIEWRFFRITDDGPLIVKRIAKHHILKKEIEGISAVRLLAGEYIPFDLDKTSLTTKDDQLTYEYDSKTKVFVCPDTPFGFGASYQLDWSDRDAGELPPRNRQAVTFRDKTIYLAVAPSDSITNLEDKNTYVIAHYANGDYVKYSLMQGKEWQPFEASLKRGDGKIGRYIKNKGGRLMDAIEFTTGPCKGFFMVNHMGNILTESPINWHGDVYDAGFNYITYINEEGLTTEQRNEGKAKIEARIYQSYCQKYGKQYVDALKEHKIIPGMPEALVKDVLHYRSLSKSVAGERCAVFLSSPYFSTIENKFTDQEPTTLTVITSEYLVTFANGKVASVTFIK